MSYKTKICFICGMEYQPKSSHQKYCVQCRLGVVHEQHLLSNKQWRMSHREQKSATDKAWRINHHEQYVSMNKAWIETHPEQVKLCRKQSRSDRKQYKKQYYMDHPEKRQSPDVAKIWRLTHPEEWTIIQRKASAKRRTLGFNPLNSPFPGCEAHHINPLDVIHMPKVLHRSIYHNQNTGQGMAQMNALAGQYLTEDWA